MAADDPEKSLKDLKKEITCAICQEYYTEPKVLPCLHYYCKQCILQLALMTGASKPFSCPECRYIATLPEGGVDEFKTAFFVNRLKAIVSAMERTHGNVKLKCELCKISSDDAEAFCRQCASFICRECVNLHKRITTFESHEVVSLDDLKYGRVKPIPVKEPPTKKCLVHEEPLIIYCYDCDSLICQYCTLRDHRDHNFHITKIAAPDEKTNLLEKIKPLKDLHVELTNAKEHIQTTKIEVEAQLSSTVDTIKISFKELHDILDKREQELVEEAGEIVQGKVDKLSVQDKTLSLASAEVQSAVDYTEQCVRHCTDNEVMSMHTEMKKTIEKKIEEHSKSGRSLEPVEEADMGVEVQRTEALQQLCQTRVIITKLPIDPTKCTVHLGEAAEVNKRSSGTLITRLSNNEKTKRNCKISARIRSFHNGVITDCNIDGSGSGRHSIQYTPTVRGRHELTVLIDGQHVAGSPFPVFVSIHPTQLGKPVKVWDDVSSPIDITANSKGDVLVTNGDGNIIKFDTEGKREKFVTQNELKGLRCIAVDDKDNIYCIYEENNKILTCDINGGNVQLHTVEHENHPGRRALFIINNELLISERGSKDTIMVYDRELKYARRIYYKDMGRIMDISADVHGNIYTIDNDSFRVHVFNSGGVFLRSFGCNNNELKNPCGICVAGHYVYVTIRSNSCVSVFTTDGVYVTSFGQLGSKEGEFRFPRYLYVDKDGFVYVCDHGNSRIQCF